MMQLKFIGQGLDPDSDVTTGNFIIASLESNQYNSFNAFVAFVSTGGLKNIIDQLTVFKRNGGIMNLPQFNGHFKKYTEKWYTMQKKGVSDDRKAAEIQPGV